MKKLCTLPTQCISVFRTILSAHTNYSLNITRLILINNKLDAQFLLYIYLFRFSTCFEQPCAYHQESQLYQHNIWYMSLCVGLPVGFRPAYRKVIYTE
jgi:hypothetical protein